EAAKVLRANSARNGRSEHLDLEPNGREDAAAEFGDDTAVVELLWAACKNDVDGLRRLLAQGVPMHAQDYDRRTALHLAASEGQLAAVKYLRAHGHPLYVRDRWHSTPLDEAIREGRDEVIECLRRWMEPDASEAAAESTPAADDAGAAPDEPAPDEE
ncbi:MAG: ankyrin repeat domain-containing protein, partial [Myxococcales bacterium]|nr:ankyrin repeat domain-containing protein [Myxococcales bacterium]